MKIYVLTLTTGRHEDVRTTLLRSYIQKEEAERERLIESVRLEEVVRKSVRVGKLLDDWIDEHPGPLRCGDCVCGTPKTCEACNGWTTLYSIAQETIHKDVGFDPSLFPRGADEGFSVSVVEIELMGGV
jgi:hypothetical protein